MTMMKSATIVAATLSAFPLAFAATFEVQVGANSQFNFDPPFVAAQAGDMIDFVFHPKAHSATQSSFNAPCVAIPGGADSGLIPVASEADVGANTTWTFHVQDVSAPIWMYCKQTNGGSHCGKGMVFAVNPPPEGDPHSFSAFQNLAIQLNGTGVASSTTPAQTSSSTFTPPPAQTWATATATVSSSGSTWVTTYTSYEGTPAPTFAPQPVDHKILVGADGLTFSGQGPNISAAIGDTVTFEFHPKAHSVTQSSFQHPCQPLADTNPGQIGFDSGLTPVDANATTFPTWTVTINDTAPIWGYCKQTNGGSHCGQGMVFSINAVESGPNNFAAFRQIAINTNGSTASNSSSSASSASGTQTGGSSPTPSGNSGMANARVPVGAVGTLIAGAFVAFFL